MDTRAYRTYQALLLAGLAVFLLWKVVDGDILLYLHQRFVLLIVLAALALLALAQWALRSRSAAGHSPEFTSAGSSARAHLLLWLALPLLAGILLPAHAPETASDLALAAPPSTAVVYLSSVDAPELWRIDLDGSARALTSSGGNVVDYAVSPAGDWIVYSQGNEQGGVDLWQIRTDGSAASLLLPCGTDSCTNPAIHPDGVQVAYSRRQAGVFEMEGAGVPRLWLLNRESGATEQLHSDPNIGGYEPSWSADGRWLAYFDGLSTGVRVYDSQSGAETLLPTQMGITGVWGADGRLYYLDNEMREEQPAVQVRWFAPADGQTDVVLGETGEPRDYSLPAVAPDGSRAAVALRPTSGGPTKQLWLVSLIDQTETALIVDPTHHYGAYTWDATGERLLFQRFSANQSDSRPQVAYWDGETVRVLADDAYQPHWLP